MDRTIYAPLGNVATGGGAKIENSPVNININIYVDAGGEARVAGRRQPGAFARLFGSIVPRGRYCRLSDEQCDQVIAGCSDALQGITGRRGG